MGSLRSPRFRAGQAKDERKPMKGYASLPECVGSECEGANDAQRGRNETTASTYVEGPSTRERFRPTTSYNINSPVRSWAGIFPNRPNKN